MLLGINFNEYHDYTKTDEGRWNGRFGGTGLARWVNCMISRAQAQAGTGFGTTGRPCLSLKFWEATEWHFRVFWSEARLP